jgi:GTPase-associated protein 1, N-terminal domain type 2/GTPase-associated protein 1, middle domain
MLRSRVVTQFDSEGPLSAFPSASELASVPRRLTYVSDGVRTGVYWHSVMAGRDATGRPGNVFSHVLLDRATDEASPAFRPIELWRSPDILCPFGPDQVGAASLNHSDPPAFGVTTNRQSVLEFLFDPAEWRVGLLSVLLDAVHAALLGGPKVILSTDSADRAAMWIAAVSMLMSPNEARNLNFSVYERSNGLQSLMERGVHLICIPAADVALIPTTADAAILDEHEIPNLGDVGGPAHETHAGSKIGATYWSTLAQAALIDFDTADAAMAALNDVSSRVTGSGPEPAWPLAMATLVMPDRFEDVQSEASLVVERWSPETLRGDEALFSIATSTFNKLSGSSAEDVWERLNQASVSSVTQEMYAQTYIERVLTDWDWLARPGDAPLPTDVDSLPLPPRVKTAAEKAVLELPKTLAAAASVRQSLAALTLLNFIHRTALIELDENTDEELKDSLALVVERLIGEVVDDDRNADSILETAPQPSSPFILQNVLTSLENTRRFQSEFPGHRVPAGFFAWLFNGSPFADAAAAAKNLHLSVPPLVLEYAIWRCRTGVTSLDHARPLAAVGLMQAVQAGAKLDSLADEVIIADPAWTAVELLAVEREFPGILEPDFFIHALLNEDSSRDLLDLCRLIVANRGQVMAEREAVRLANLRLLVTSDWTDGDMVAVLSKAEWILAAAGEDLGQRHRLKRAPELSSAVLVAATISLTAEADVRTSTKTRTDLIQEFETRAGAEKARADLERFVERGTMGTQQLEALAVQAITTMPGYPGPAPDHRTQRAAAAGLRAGMDTRLIDVVIRHAFKVGAAPDQEGFFSNIAGSIWDSLRHALPERQAEKIYSECERFARDWWKNVQEFGNSANQVSAKSRILGVFKPAARKD